MKQKGFAITGVLYVLLIIFLASLTMLLFHLQNRKMLLDQLKLDVVEAVESENNYEYLLNKISELEAKIGNTDISSVGNGTLTDAIYHINSIPRFFSSEIIRNQVIIPNGESIDYIAEQDCYAVVQLHGRLEKADVAFIDGIRVADVYSEGSDIIRSHFLLPLKKGQTLTLQANAHVIAFSVYKMQ